jgi:myo-inositol-1(or 4)-monophosphatase
MGNGDGRTQRLQAAQEVARIAGKLLANRPDQGLQTATKGRNDFVTVMDVQSEKLIKEYLHQRFPEDNFLGEEMGFEKYGDGGTWIIDPIDGTTNYIHGLPGFTISIAYEEKRWNPVIGVVYDPTGDEMFAAQEGKGSYLNGKPISASTVGNPYETVIMISPPLRKMQRMDDYMRMLEVLSKDSGEMRDYGSAALHLSYIAAGRAEAFIEFNLGYHDIAAGVVILSEAGGKISPIDLGDLQDWTSNIIATNDVLHSWFTRQIQIPR